ncbi:hypothetical protein ABCS02_25505 [Microbacterium sp. X-17]|uniref:hypothetical protein n=1 Tax=Microbacterium sp. X-17 TaxID=3144404 RepID=UPI0031F59C00
MALAGLVLISIGLLDLARDLRPPRWTGLRSGILTALLAGVVVVAAASVALSLGYSAFAALAPLVAVAAWWALLPDRPLRSPRLALGLPVLLAVAIVLLIALPAPGGPSVLRDAYATTSFASAVSLDGILLIAGVTLFLVSPGNRIVRIALQDEIGPGAATSSATPVVGGLKGGRLIGPLERILILGLFVANAAAVIAALIAAKGIVRFPEISKDAEGGNRAEYFLIGSLVSWATALAGVGALWLAHLLPV